MTGLAGKVAVVTGAGRGIGREHSRVLAARGARVIAVDIDGAGAGETVRQISAAGGHATALVCDITDVPALRAAIAEVEASHGRIDVLVNNAGVHRAQAIAQITPADFDWMFATHVKGTFFATQAVIPGMKARRAGNIISTASAWAMIGNPTDSHYCGAKAAILGLTKAWAKEFVP